MLNRFKPILLMMFIAATLLIYSCGDDNGGNTVDFNNNTIEGTYISRIIIQPPGTAPSISLFGVEAVVDLVSNDSFTVSIDDDDIPDFTGTLLDKIISPEDPANGGVMFEIEPTENFFGDVNTMTVQPVVGAELETYGYFVQIDQSDSDIKFVLKLIEQDGLVTRYTITACKNNICSGN